MMDNTIALTENDIMLIKGLVAHLKVCKYEPKHRPDVKHRAIGETLRCMSPSGRKFLEREMDHLLETFAA